MYDDISNDECLWHGYADCAEYFSLRLTNEHYCEAIISLLTSAHNEHGALIERKTEEFI